MTTSVAETGPDPLAWWDPAYPFRRRVELHPQLFEVMGPITVRLDVGRELPLGLSEGMGLAFVRSDADVLPHEVEEWSDSSSTLWVRLDSVGPDPVFVYYGAEDESPPTEITGQAWADPYLAVWHMTSAFDASGNGNDLLDNPPWGQPFIGQTGAFGSEFPGIGLAEGELSGIELGGATVMAWMFAGPVGTPRSRIVHRQGDGATRGFSFFYDSTREAIGISFGRSNSPDVWYTSDGTVTSGEWHHVAVVIEENAPVAFGIDGTLVPPVLDQAGAGEIIPSVEEPWFVGGDIDGAEPFQGTLDELRIYLAPMSDEELWREYVAQSIEAAALGEEEAFQ